MDTRRVATVMKKHLTEIIYPSYGHMLVWRTTKQQKESSRQSPTYKTDRTPKTHKVGKKKKYQSLIPYPVIASLRTLKLPTAVPASNQVFMSWQGDRGPAFRFFIVKLPYIAERRMGDRVVGQH